MKFMQNKAMRPTHPTQHQPGMLFLSAYYFYYNDRIMISGTLAYNIYTNFN